MRDPFPPAPLAGAQMRQQFFQPPGQPYRIAYTEWGQGSDLVICVHGLTRNSRDFDRVAAALAARGKRVICPDMVGRGRSDWAESAETYAVPQYVGDVAALIAHLGAASVDWLGTSMGGIIGMALAAMPGTPIRRMVLNDVGALIPRASLMRLSLYVGADPRFGSIEEADAYLRAVLEGFGPIDDAGWRHLAETSTRQREDGSIGFSYDPRIGDGVKDAAVADIDLWPLFTAIQVPMLVIRGESSDLLLAETAAAMAEAKPGLRLETVAGCGHAPSLMQDDQIAVVADFLCGGGA